MKKALLTSLAALLLAGCADNEFLGSEEALHTVNGDKAILFTSQSAPMTRGEKGGSDAAALLGNNYVVMGVKSNGTTASQQVVFNHYNINWKAGTAGSTETNVANWEYVGMDPHTNAFTGAGALPTGAKQFIKYWDFSASQYDFAAFSYGTTDKSKLTLSQINLKNIGNDGVTSGKTDPVYTVKGKVSDLVNAYVANLVTVPKADYNKTVTPKFRQMGSKVRIAIYETVAGYAVKDVKFHTSDTRATSPSNDPVLYAGNAVLPDITANTEGTMKVYFPTIDTNNPDYNKALVVFEGATSTSGNLTSTLKFKPLKYNDQTTEGVLTGSYLGQTSNGATYATTSDAAGAYEMVLPYGEGNDLKLHVDYTLVSVDGSGETINVKSATAIVPSTYTNWQPNYAYTYIFKISKDSNGTTGTPGSDPAGLYPITFDAIVMDFDDEHVQETITTVSTPSITTYSKGGQPTASSEYKAGNNIYVSVDQATIALSAANAKLYTATVESGALQGIDENSIANALKNGTPDATAGSWTVTDAAGKKLVVKVATATMTFPSEIAVADSPDGNTISGKFAMFTPSAAGTYVFEYISAQAVSYADVAEYNTAKGTNLDADAFAALSDADKIKTPAKKHYKIIIVK